MRHAVSTGPLCHLFFLFFFFFFFFFLPGYFGPPVVWLISSWSMIRYKKGYCTELLHSYGQCYYGGAIQQHPYEICMKYGIGILITVRVPVGMSLRRYPFFPSQFQGLGPPRDRLLFQKSDTQEPLRSHGQLIYAELHLLLLNHPRCMHHSASLVPAESSHAVTIVDQHSNDEDVCCSYLLKIFPQDKKLKSLLQIS